MGSNNKTSYKNSFGYKMRCIRKFRHFSQKEMSDMLGISESTLARYEKNESLPHIDVVIRFVKITRISTDMLIY